MVEKAVHAGEAFLEITLPATIPLRWPKPWRLVRGLVSSGRSASEWSFREAAARSGPAARESRAAEPCPTFGASPTLCPDLVASSQWTEAVTVPVGVPHRQTILLCTTGSSEASGAWSSVSRNAGRWKDARVSSTAGADVKSGRAHRASRRASC